MGSLLEYLGSYFFFWFALTSLFISKALASFTTLGFCPIWLRSNTRLLSSFCFLATVFTNFSTLLFSVFPFSNFFFTTPFSRAGITKTSPISKRLLLRLLVSFRFLTDVLNLLAISQRLSSFITTYLFCFIFEVSFG